MGVLPSSTDFQVLLFRREDKPSAPQAVTPGTRGAYRSFIVLYFPRMFLTKYDPVDSWYAAATAR